MSTSKDKKWMSNAEAQEYLGVGPTFFKRLRANAQISFSKVGKTVFYKKSDLDKLIESSKVI